MMIEIQHLSKYYGSFHVLQDINLTIQEGELVALLGPSGSGKTTLLRVIAGLEIADEGIVVCNGEDLTHVHVQDRQVGFVFQHYALFKHMTVFENVAFGLKARKKKWRPSPVEIKEKVQTLLELVKMQEFSSRYPSQLSGGQRQRIALARALAVEPKILLLDEPFGALDAKVRKELRRWLRRLHDEFKITSIFVTHDQEEALDVADRIVIMNQGKIEQIGTPQDIYEQPASSFVYDFLGNVNLFHGRLREGKLDIGAAQFSVADDHHPFDIETVGYVRPHHLMISRQKTEQDTITARISHLHTVGPIVHVELKREETQEYLEAQMSVEQFHALQLRIGETVYVSPQQVKVFIPSDFVI
ncbi:sulfate/molybdate ABC transporter ATP-binding protein [Ectobacillus antri]|jgi:sulfate transport system ATP-binding protein|uniref:Sulfate/molybdate ABC transporter ATP-binding protein n=1 Tax=Ectobacillus antri TaxID=2486280 RepID=A0ABT6H9W7_9BACI|nr:sulfate/molybdate ABC transporter ATP-binding protein [Ectobacillus antri]MDG4658441.1 sulfate/molybdate ABC transporter ATP-binding protein [Ectobacillus antri]MDG5755480.1 sulfate/molybdate ABC transporter ATP-binding protein [Ectobacillus antri]